MANRLAALVLGGCGTATPQAVVPTSCADAISGSAGASTSTSASLSFQREGDLWLSEAVRVSVDRDVRGLSLTADVGFVPSAIWSVDQDGRSAFSADGVTLIRGAGTGRTDGADSGWDSAWDTSWDSGGGDTAWDTGDAPGQDYPGWGAFPHFHLPGFAATLQRPMNDATPPWAGCLEVVVAATESPDPGASLVVGLQRGSTPALFNLSLLVLAGAQVADDDLAGMAAVVDQVYRDASAPGVGAIELFTFDAGTSRPRLQDLPRIRSVQLEGARPGATTVVVAEGIAGSPGLLGIAAGIPGPPGLMGTPASGVTLNLSAHRDADGRLNVRLLGETLAHELGHQLGLFHTTEATGRGFDVISDTPECAAARFDADGDRQLSAEECAGVDGENLMFWTAGSFSQDQLTAEQVRVLDASPAAERMP